MRPKPPGNLEYRHFDASELPTSVSGGSVKDTEIAFAFMRPTAFSARPESIRREGPICHVLAFTLPFMRQSRNQVGEMSGGVVTNHPGRLARCSSTSA
jgi:hypothetical protein